MRRRMWTVSAALLLVLALVPWPAAAASQTQGRTESKTRSGFAALWEAVLGVLTPQVIFGRLGAGMDPGGSPAPPTNGAPGIGARPARPAYPDNDLGPGMDLLG
jgi:hypothetical protein